MTPMAWVAWAAAAPVNWETEAEGEREGTVLLPPVGVGVVPEALLFISECMEE